MLICGLFESLGEVDYESQLAGSLLIANEVSRRGSGGQAVARSPLFTELGAVDGW